MIRRPPRSTLFPYTTLFRSRIRCSSGFVVAARRPAFGTGNRFALPLRTDEAALFQATQHRIDGAAGQARRVHDFETIAAATLNRMQYGGRGVGERRGHLLHMYSCYIAPVNTLARRHAS